MSTQNYRNHSRYVTGYHFVAFSAILVLHVGAWINFFQSDAEDRFGALLICLASIIFVLLFWYARVFALRAQDRAIRAEENFRYYLMTGKPLPAELRMAQIIALRFTSDDEFVALIQRALNEKLSANAIKQSIQHWRADFYRV